MAKLTDQIPQHRQNRCGSKPIFINRWSPRAMTGETIADEVLMGLFEAAHWAMSSNNNQPWRFIYARRDHSDWNKFLGLLAEGNRVWCVNAAMLMVMVAKTTFDNGKPARTHAFDTGAAWGMFALEGASRGLVVHGMQGFDYDRAKSELGVPDGYEVQAMAAVGILADADTLPEPYREREKPSTRKELAGIAAEGGFTENIR
ncbi:MAG: nitroreductase family protein [candidate division Zixibacteria bacterium]|nr:nitroreductase family protein [candidate division Zixibacteria bacterium]